MSRVYPCPIPNRAPAPPGCNGRCGGCGLAVAKDESKGLWLASRVRPHYPVVGYYWRHHGFEHQAGVSSRCMEMVYNGGAKGGWEMARLSVAVDPDLLERVRRMAGVRTKREALGLALAEFVRRRELKRLRDLEGSGLVSMNLRELQAWRRSSLKEDR